MIVRVESWINSSLTDRLREVLQSGFYARALWYLCHVADGTAEPLEGQGIALWQAVEAEYGVVGTDDALKLLGFSGQGGVRDA
jgi:hypothetical protein